MTVHGVVEKKQKPESCKHPGADGKSEHDYRILYCSDCNRYLRYAIADYWCGWIPANIIYRILFVWGRF